MWIAYGSNGGWLMRRVDAVSFIQIRAQCFVKLADQIVRVLNQLMGFSYALSSSWNTGPYANLRTNLWKISGTFAESFRMSFGSHKFSYNKPLSSGSLLAWVDLLINSFKWVVIEIYVSFVILMVKPSI